MKCTKCGNEIDGNSKFCPECGTKIEVSQEKKTIQLRCRSCNGVMTADEETPVLTCKFCGSKELMQESDDVKIQRIKSKTYKEVELEKMKHEERKEMRQEEKEKNQAQEKELKKFKKSKLSKIVLVLFFISLLVAWNSFSNKNFILGIIAGAQTALFALSWLTGMQFVRKKRPNIHILFAVGGIILMFVFFKVKGETISESEMYNWPTGGMLTVLPEPKSKVGDIIEFTDTVYLTVKRTSAEEYEAYLESCIEKGFTIEAERETTDYAAYNGEGYKLDLSYNKTGESMRIELEAPLAVEEITWPSSELANMLPVPEVSIGQIKYDSSSSFMIYVGNTSIDEFKAYVDECISAGFDVDYQRRDTSYSADNSSGYHLSVVYEGFDTIYIRIEAPEDKSEEADDGASNENGSDEDAEASKNEEAKTTETAAASTGGIRPEFKEAMDSYEAFFDEYIEFMESYDENDAAMLLKSASMLSQYAKTMDKMEKMGEEEMSAEETAYYIEVTARINQKLLAVQ